MQSSLVLHKSCHVFVASLTPGALTEQPPLAHSTNLILSWALPGLPPNHTHWLPALILTSHVMSGSANGHPQVLSPHPSASLKSPSVAPTGKHLIQAEAARLPSKPHGHWCFSRLLAGTSGTLGHMPSSWQALCPAAFQWTCYLCLSAMGFLHHTRKTGNLKICLNSLGLVWCPKGGASYPHGMGACTPRGHLPGYSAKYLPCGQSNMNSCK